MIYQVFTTLLKWKPTRRLLQIAKHVKLFQIWVPMLREWAEKDNISQYPEISLLGMDGINNFKIIANNFKFNSPLLVTDPVLIKTGVVQAVIKQLDYLKIKYTIFDGVQPNPSIQVVQKIIDMYQTSKSDALISIGGGSAHDAIKGASLVLSNKGRELKKFQGLNVTPNVSIAPIIAINTTAGTGSDVTNAAVITDEVKHFKMTLVDKNIQPHAIVDDSNLMLGLPAKQSAWVGIDALVHGIEAELSIFSNLTSRTYARQTMRIVYQHLPLVYEKTDNKFAREKMAYAEFLGGLAFNSASLGFIHSMSHAMSGVFNTPHGLANAVLLPYVLDYELKSKKIVPKIANLSRFMQMNNASEDVFGKAQETIRNLIAFTKALGVPSNLSEVQPKISKKDIRQMAKKAMKDFCGISNPIQFSRREVIRIYHNAISGKFDNI